MKAKKILGILLSLAMAVTAFAAFAVNASAADIKKLSSGKTYSVSFQKNREQINYKVVTNKSGKLKLTFSSQVGNVIVRVTDTSNKNIKPTDAKDTLGSSSWSGWSDCCYLEWNKTERKYKGTLTYEVSKGTYYVNLESYTLGDNKLSFIPTFPSNDSGSDVKINNLTLTMKAGSTLQLGTALSASTDDNVAWKSSKTSVAKVSATGLVTAKAAGTATITATIGDSSQKIDIIVKK